MVGPVSKLWVRPPPFNLKSAAFWSLTYVPIFSIKFRRQIENQRSNYRLLGVFSFCCLQIANDQYKWNISSFLYLLNSTFFIITDIPVIWNSVKQFITFSFSWIIIKCFIMVTIIFMHGFIMVYSHLINMLTLHIPVGLFVCLVFFLQSTDLWPSKSFINICVKFTNNLSKMLKHWNIQKLSFSLKTAIIVNTSRFWRLITDWSFAIWPLKWPH